MITKLNVTGFKGFEQLELSKISRVTLIGGKNNVGKTALLEALFMFFDRLNPQMILRQSAWRGVSMLPLDADTMWTPIFYKFNMEKPITVCATMVDIEEEMTIRFNPSYVPSIVHAKTVKKGTPAAQILTDQAPTPSYALDLQYQQKNKESQTAHLIIGPTGLGLQVDYMVSQKRTAVFLGARIRVNPAEDAERFGKLDIVGRQDKILEFLKILEPELRDLSSITIGETSLIHGDIGMGRKIPVAYMGDGMSRLLSIILAIATSPGGLVLIDECENGIHHSKMSKVWEGIGWAAREFDCQVIGTTHSYECLEAAHEGFAGELAGDFSYVRIDKIGDRTVAKTFDYESLTVVIDANMEVR
jgi:hypothetical protein